MTAIAQLDARAVRALRMAAQRIGGPAPIDAPDADRPGGPVAAVARHMLALQGQDAPGVRWSVGLRSPGVTDAAVAAALASAEVVRTWPMRGTLHLLHPADVRWLLGLTAERQLAAMAARRSALGITGDDCTRAVDVAHAILGGRRAVGRADFLAALDAAGVSIAGQRGYHLLAWVAISGHVVLGGDGGSQPAVLLADEWLPPARSRDRDEALAELALRYVAGHGPASEADLARWVGLPVTQVRRGLVAAGPALERVAVDGAVHYVEAGACEAGAVEALEAPAERLHLLSGFDEYLLGYADRTSALAAEHMERIVPGGNGMFRPSVLLDGRVAGAWARTVRAKGIRISVEPFTDELAPFHDQLAAAAAAYGAFAGRPVTVVGPSSPSGSHVGSPVT